MSGERPPAQERLTAYLVGFRAVWIVDIGLKRGLLAAIADATHGTDEDDLAVTPASWCGRTAWLTPAAQPRCRGCPAATVRGL